MELLSVKGALSTPVLVVYGILLLVGICTAASHLFRPLENTATPYMPLPHLLTAAERSLFGVLHQAIGDEYQIFAKVRLADVIQPVHGLRRDKRQIAFNRIQAKHLDFVVCDPSTLRILGVIELDDSSHAECHRQKRDKFLEAALRAAGLPLLRVPVAHNYALAHLQEQCGKLFAVQQKAA